MDAKGRNVWTALSSLHLSLVPSPHHIYSLICSTQDAVAHTTQWLLPMGSTGGGIKRWEREVWAFLLHSLPAQVLPTYLAVNVLLCAYR